MITSYSLVLQFAFFFVSVLCSMLCLTMSPSLSFALILNILILKRFMAFSVKIFFNFYISLVVEEYQGNNFIELVKCWNVWYMFSSIEEVVWSTYIDNVSWRFCFYIIIPYLQSFAMVHFESWLISTKKACECWALHKVNRIGIVKWRSYSVSPVISNPMNTKNRFGKTSLALECRKFDTKSLHTKTAHWAQFAAFVYDKPNQTKPNHIHYRILARNHFE